MPASEESVVDLLAHPVEQGDVRIQVFTSAVGLHRPDPGTVGAVHFGQETGYGHIISIHHHGNVIHKGQLAVAQASGLSFLLDGIDGQQERFGLGTVLIGSCQQADGKLTQGFVGGVLHVVLGVVLPEERADGVDDNFVFFVSWEKNSDAVLLICFWIERSTVELGRNGIHQ